jgi:hypothetical protein
MLSPVDVGIGLQFAATAAHVLWQSHTH